jgi:hypothetical protein
VVDGIDAHKREAAVLVEPLQAIRIGTKPDAVEVFVLAAEAFADGGVEEFVEPARCLAGRHLSAEFTGGEGFIAFKRNGRDLILAAAGGLIGA